jgi:rhodanese-related sulfurtransferase
MTGQQGVPDVPEIDVVSAWDRARNNESYIVDVRESDELAEVSVPSAIHVPLGSIPAEAGTLPRDREILVICRSGVRSAYATQFLLASGIEGVKNVSGGVIAWAQAGLPYTSHGTVYNNEADGDSNE